MTQEFVYPSAYGGAVKSDKLPMIHDYMTLLRKEVGHVAAKRQQGGPMFPVRGAKELMQKLADACNKLNMVVCVVAQEITHCDVNNIPKNETKSGNPVFRTLVHCKSTVRFIAPDTSFIDVVGSGHGGDVDDKSGGKASTYAAKDAIFKALTTPDAEMVDTDDEAPSADRHGGKEVAPAPKRAAEAVAKPSGGEATGGAPAGKAAGVVDVPDASRASGVAEVESRIADAKGQADLEALRSEIKSGAIALSDADRLKVSKAFTAKANSFKVKE